MRRFLPFLVLCTLACDSQTGKPATGPVAKKETVPPKPPVLPTTGSPMLRDMREGLVEDIERMEKELEEGKPPERRYVDAAKKGAERLVTAARLAVDREAEETVRRELAMLRERQAAIDKGRSDLAAGILEIQGFLDRIERGIEKPPEGFTEDELRDRLGKRQEEARALEKEDAELRARMQEKEETLAKGNIQPQGTTVLTHELEAAEELKARAEALEARLK